MANASDEDRQGELLIQEVDDDLRHEQYAKLWKQYGVYVIAGAVAVIVAVAGWQAWLGWQERVRLEAAGRYAAAIALLNDGKTKEGEDALAKIDSGDKGFAVLAAMRRADLLIKDGDTKGALGVYEQVANSDAPGLLRDLATIKEGLLALNSTEDTSAVEARIGALATSGNAWYYQANELLAAFAHKKGDDKHAIAIFKQLADDAQAPPGARARAAEMLAILAPTAAAPNAPPAAAKVQNAAPEKAPAQDKQ